MIRPDARADLTAAPRRPGGARRRRTLAVGLSLAAHLALVPLLLMVMSEPRVFSASDDEFDSVEVTLAPPAPRPAPDLVPTDDAAASAEAPSQASAADDPDPVPDPAPARVVTPRPTPPPPPLRTRTARPAPVDVPTVVASTAPTPATFVGLGEAELGGASVAGTGGGSGSGTGSGSGSGEGAGSGGPCDMIRRIQDALRADPDISRTAAEAHSTLGREGSGRRRALLMWNGDWLQSPGQAGKGLAGVRQAIALEIAFSPPACRRQSMRGYALISLGDAPDSARIALGAPSWRWSDLARGR